MTTEPKQPGKRAYEAWRGPRVDIFGPWESLIPSEMKSWAAVESALAADSQVACAALADALGLAADHPQRRNLSWLVGRVVGELEGLKR